MAAPKKRTIGERDESWLSKFIDRRVQETSVNLPPSLTGEEIRASSKLVVDDDIELSPQAVTKLKSYLGLP